MHALLLIAIILLLSQGSCEEYAYPAANTGANRVLSMVVAFSLSRMDPLMLIFRGHQSMCEAGWEVTFTIFTAHKVSLRMRRFLESKLYCHRLQTNIPLLIHERDPSVHINLVEETRDYLRGVWQQHDVYIYMEEDVVVDYAQLVGYLAETLRLQKLLGKEEVLNNYYVGFQRYRRHLVPMEKNRVHMTEAELLLQEYLEEVPFFRPVCYKDQPYMHVLGNKRTSAANVYQGMWMLTKEQVAALQTKCKFLDQTFRGTPMQKTGYVREYLGSLSLLDNDIIGPSCGLQKVIPAGRLLDFAVWHYYYSTNPLLLHEDHPLFGTHEHVQAGLLQASTPLAHAGYFDAAPCWAPIVAKQRADFNISLPADSVFLLNYGRNTMLLKQGARHRVPNDAVLRAHGYEGLPVHSMKHLMFDFLPSGPDLQ